MTRSENMEHVEVLRDLSEVCRAAIKAGDWKVDGACDPDSLLRHADAAIAALSAPQPPAEAQACGCGEATCVVPWEPGCGLGKSEQHAEAQAQGDGEASEGWHAALDSASELVSNAPDARYRKRAEQVRDWIKAHPAEAQPVEKETDGEILNRLGDDAQKWAQEFRKTAIQLGYSDMDEGWLIGWFANAIEHSSDVRRWRNEAQRCTCPSGDGSLRWPCPAHPPEAQPVSPTDGSPFDMAMREYEAAAIKCGAGRNNAQAVDAAADRVFALYNAKPPSAPVGVEVVRRVAENIRANLDSLPSIARVWADDLDQALAQQPAAEDDLNTWRAAFIAERAMRYREGGMAIEQARIHAETDAAHMEALAAAAAQQGGGTDE